MFTLGLFCWLAVRAPSSKEQEQDVMRSSFSRKAPAAADTGTRPGLHGQTLVSMGLVDLDRLLGGGLPLGTLLLVLEDPHSSQHLNFLKYFIAEGISTGQRVAWLATQLPRGGAGQFLPAEASTSDASQSKAAKDEEDDESQAELRIAWQYRKYIQQEQEQRQAQQQQQAGAKTASGASRSGAAQATRSAVEAGIGKQWCHSYDLTKSLGSERVGKSSLALHNCTGPSGGSDSSLNRVLQLSHSFVQTVQAATTGPVLRGPDGVGRLVVQSLGSPMWWGGCSEDSDGGVSQANSSSRPSEQERQLVCCVQQLRQLVQDTRCAAMVTCPAGLLHSTTIARLQHAADAVLAVQTIGDDSQVFALLPDAASAVALVSVNKLPAVGMLAPRLPDSTLYVVRNKRRRLAITPVDVDPDAEARQQQQQQQAAASLASSGTSADGRPGAATRARPNPHNLNF